MREDSGKRIRADRRPAYSLLFGNASPVESEREKDWLVTVCRPKGLFYALFIAPLKSFPTYQATFEVMLGSIQFC